MSSCSYKSIRREEWILRLLRYVKMDAANPLLLSEGCVSSAGYHEDVCPRQKFSRRNDQSGQARVVGVVSEKSSEDRTTSRAHSQLPPSTAYTWQIAQFSEGILVYAAMWMCRRILLTPREEVRLHATKK